MMDQMTAQSLSAESLTAQVQTALTAADHLGLVDVALQLNAALVILDGVGDAGDATETGWFSEEAA